MISSFESGSVYCLRYASKRSFSLNTAVILNWTKCLAGEFNEFVMRLFTDSFVEFNVV